MSTERHFIQPGDSEINFSLPLSLSEIKHIHRCVADRYEADGQNGSIITPTEILLTKLDNLIVYLQAEHYPNS
jgi:hypothetical protein